MKSHYNFLLVTLFSLTTFLSTAQDNLNMELVAQVSFGQEESNDIWGYVAPDGTEYAVIGCADRTRVFDLTDPTNPIEVAEIFGNRNSVHRDIKANGEYLYVTCDQGSDGLLIIDMTEAPGNITHKFWQPTINGNPLSTCHNLYIDENGVCYLAGCGPQSPGGIIMLDITTDPLNPSVLGQINERYSHDVMVKDNIVYSSEISDGILAVYDVTDKANYVTLGTVETSFAFTHNTWISDDGQYAFTTDERPNATVDAYDITDLGDMRRLDRFQPAETAGRGVIPHNTHYKDGFLVTSWYTDGVVITDVTHPDNMIKVGSYDTFLGPDGNFNGCWGVYPWLPSGLIIASDINTGLYILRPTYVKASYLEGTVTDMETGDPINNATIEIAATQMNSKMSNTSGEYKTGVAEAGTYEVRFSHPDYKTAILSTTIAAGEITILNAQLETKKRALVSGTVVSAKDGTPIKNAQVLFFNSDREFALNTDSNGAFSTQVFEEDYEVVIGAWGYNHLTDLTSITTGADLNYELEFGYMDDFVLDQGWKVDANVILGNWRRASIDYFGFPGVTISPDGDVIDDIGNQCYYTSVIEGFEDILAGGETSLTSPPMDLTPYKEPVLEFQYFIFNGSQGGAGDDALDVFLIVNDTDTLQLTSLMGDTGDWSDKQSINLTDFTQDLENVKIEFFASEDSGFEINNTAVDVFRIIEGESVNTDDLFTQSVINIAPNPFTNTTFISYDKDYESMEIYNSIGELVQKRTIEGLVIELGNQLESGIHFIKLEGKNIESDLIKIVKL